MLITDEMCGMLFSPYIILNDRFIFIDKSSIDRVTSLAGQQAAQSTVTQRHHKLTHGLTHILV